MLSCSFSKLELSIPKKDERFTNRFTVGDLFPNEDPVDALKRELLKIETENYIETAKDIKFPKRSEMRIFGRRYNVDVYIKTELNLCRLVWLGLTIRYL